MMKKGAPARGKPASKSQPPKKVSPSPAKAKGGAGASYPGVHQQTHVSDAGSEE